MGQTIAQLQSADEEQRREIAELKAKEKAKEEAREHELGDQLRYEVVDRFCRGMFAILPGRFATLLIRCAIRFGRYALQGIRAITGSTLQSSI